jgi:hypothetical protein
MSWTFALVFVLVGFAPASVGEWNRPHTAQADVCGKRYVAGGDHIPAGHDIAESERYPNHLIDDHMQALGWCVYNTAKDGTTSATYISGGQIATAWNMQPDFITLTVGGENATIVDLIDSCFNKVKDHDFTGANSCFNGILSNTAIWSSLNNNLITTLNYYTRIMSGRPWLVVALTGYPNPYPQAADTFGPIAALCAGVIDAMTSCNQRWSQLPPALIAADNVVKKLNTTIENAVKPFAIGWQGRFVFVNPYDKFKGHAMKIDVTLRLDLVCHLCGTKAQYFDTHISNQNVGSSDPWFKAGSDGTKSPDYLTPGPLINPPVVIQHKSQTTSGMGIHPNDAGNTCISDLVWEAVKWKLNVGEPANSNICQ